MDLKDACGENGEKDDKKDPADITGPAVATTINPETMIDYFDENGKSSGSVRAMVDRELETLEGCHHRTWHQMLWRQAMIMIASHMDGGSPLNRIICWTIEDSSTHVENISIANADVKIASGGCGELKSSGDSVGDGLRRGIIIDILSIKQMATSVSPNTPVVFVRFAETTTGSDGLLPRHNDLLVTPNTADCLREGRNGLADDSALNSCTIHCTSREFESILSILEEESRMICSSYQKKWKQRSTDNDLFKLSLIRPTTEPSLPCELSTTKAITCKESTPPRRQKQKRPCALPGCVSNAQHQCSVCKTTYYCCVDHQKEHRSDHKTHCVPPPPLEPADASSLTESAPTSTTAQTTTAQSNVSIATPSSAPSSPPPDPQVISEAVTTAPTPPEFNPFVDRWPGTFGTHSNPPSEDIWDDATPKQRSVLVDLKNVRTANNTPKPETERKHIQ